MKAICDWIDAIPLTLFEMSLIVCLLIMLLIIGISRIGE